MYVCVFENYIFSMHNFALYMYFVLFNDKEAYTMHLCLCQKEKKIKIK